MVVTFDLPVRPEGELVVVDETDDGFGVFERVAKGLGKRGDGRGRRPRLGGDDAQSRPGLRLRAAPDGVVARQRAPPREDRGGARRDGASVPDGRAGDGGGHAPRRARRDDGGAARRGRAPAAARGLADAVVRDAHLHGHGRGQPRLERWHGARPAAARHRCALRLRRRGGRVLLGLRPHGRRRRAERRTSCTRTT